MKKKHKKLLIVGVIFLLGILPRLYLMPIPNSDDDMFFQAWTKRIIKHGLSNIYNSQLGFNTWGMHPPLNYYLLWATGSTYQKLFANSFRQFNLESIKLMILTKIPNLICDLLIAIIIYLAVSKNNNFKLAILALCFYLFSPAMIWEGAYIGQIESLQSILMLLSIVFLGSNKIELSWITITMGILTKAQCIIFAPLILLASILKFPFKRVVRALFWSLLVASITLLPWIYYGKISDILSLYINGTIDNLPFVALGAGNIWSLWTSFLFKEFALGYTNTNSYWLIKDSQPLLDWPHLSYKQFGLLLFAIWYLIAILCLLKKRTRFNLYQTASLVCFSFFMLPTQMLERYLYPLFPLLAITLFSKKNLIIYLASSISFFINLYLVFPLAHVSPLMALANPNDQSLYQYLRAPFGTSRLLTVTISCLNLGLFLFLTFQTLDYSFNFTNKSKSRSKKAVFKNNQSALPHSPIKKQAKMF
jgi:hypothetical protein